MRTVSSALATGVTSASAGTFDSVNPAQLSDVVARVELALHRDLARAPDPGLARALAARERHLRPRRLRATVVVAG